MTLEAKDAAALFTSAQDTIRALLSENVDERAKERLRGLLDSVDKMQVYAGEKDVMLLDLQKELAELKDKLKEIEQWSEHFANYELVSTAGGAVVYQYRGGPHHYICPSCIIKKEIQILQDCDVKTGSMVCPGCGMKFPVNEKNPALKVTYS
jgi:hypothetical protein